MTTMNDDQLTSTGDEQSSKPLIEMVFYRGVSADEPLNVFPREWILNESRLRDVTQYSWPEQVQS